MIKTVLNISMDDNVWETMLPDVVAVSRQLLALVIETLKPELLQDKHEVIVNLALSNDEEIRELNCQFRNNDRPTNVLSFANIDDDEFWQALEHTNEVELGDIIISAQTMKQQSLEQEISFHDHYCHILVHGLLHLLGYDHMEAEEAAEMEGLEIKLLKLINIANPYEEKE